MTYETALQKQLRDRAEQAAKQVERERLAAYITRNMRREGNVLSIMPTKDAR